MQNKQYPDLILKDGNTYPVTVRTIPASDVAPDEQDFIGRDGLYVGDTLAIALGLDDCFEEVFTEFLYDPIAGAGEATVKDAIREAWWYAVK